MDIEFPTNLTGEEQMLQAKYKKLREMRNALKASSTPKPPEKIVGPKKLASYDAKAVAERLLKSGQIQAIAKKQKQPEHSFKRPLTSKSNIQSQAMISGYQPFCRVQINDGSHNPENKSARMKNPDDSFGSIRDRDVTELTRRPTEICKKSRETDTVLISGFKWKRAKPADKITKKP